jgi:hypothetical protein
LPPHQEEDIVSLVLRVAVLLCVLSAPGVANAAEPVRSSFTVEVSNIVTGALAVDCRLARIEAT